MRSPQARAKRRQEVKERASEASSFFGRCRLMGCNRPSRAGTEDGLDRRYCRAHGEHLSRHGSATKGSYSASDLAPFRKVALRWLQAHAEDRWVRLAVDKVTSLYTASGPAVEAFRRRGMTPAERARAQWAQLRKREVDPLQVVAAALAVELCHAADPQPVSSPEYRQVQIAKLIHRLAGGAHKRWERRVVETTQTGPREHVEVQELHVHPRSRGRVLRHLGEDAMHAVELVVEHHLPDLQALTGGHKPAVRAT